MYVLNFSLNWRAWFIGPNFTKKGASALKQKTNEQHHRILHMRISLGTKFQVKLTFLIFLIKFVQKRTFRSKTEKSTFPHGDRQTQWYCNAFSPSGHRDKINISNQIKTSWSWKQMHLKSLSYICVHHDVMWLTCYEHCARSLY